MGPKDEMNAGDRRNLERLRLNRSSASALRPQRGLKRWTKAQVVWAAFSALKEEMW